LDSILLQPEIPAAFAAVAVVAFGFVFAVAAFAPAEALAPAPVFVAFIFISPFNHLRSIRSDYLHLKMKIYH